MPDRDLKLNSVSRYSKESSRLVLEEHSSCEIPAGCGGVVLRWFNPLRSMPLEFWMYVNGEVKFALDGNATKSARPLVGYGEHVLSFIVSGFETKAGILMFAAVAESKPKRSPELTHKPKSRIEILSDADGSWKYTLNAPGDDSWMAPGFDDADWQSLVFKPVPKPAQANAESYRHSKLVELGAKGLGLKDRNLMTRLFSRASSTDQIWIRKVFHLTPPPER